MPSRKPNRARASILNLSGAGAHAFFGFRTAGLSAADAFYSAATR